MNSNKNQHNSGECKLENSSKGGFKNSQGMKSILATPSQNWENGENIEQELKSIDYLSEQNTWDILRIYFPEKISELLIKQTSYNPDSIKEFTKKIGSVFHSVARAKHFRDNS